MATYYGSGLAVQEGNKRTIGIYTPYDLAPGGGEKYFLSIAECLGRSGHVYLVLDELYSTLRLRALGHELDLNLDHVRMLRYSDVGAVAPFDIFIAVGNEIVPPVPGFGRENYFLCQFPFPRPDHVLVERRPHWDRYDCVLTYSEFVRRNVQRITALNTLPEKPVWVLAPPCFSESSLIMDEERKRALLAAERKVKVLSVGRFFSLEHCKRHDVMIEAFAELIKRIKSDRDIELHLAGTLPPTNDSREYYLKLLELSKGLPVHFHLNVEVDELEKLYRSAAFYWHAAGIDSDPARDPETMEHFGIAVVQGMASGCVPLVVDKGGPADIVEHGVSGLHYATRYDLARMTAQLLADETKMASLRMGAMKRARVFSKEEFVKNVDAIMQPCVALNGEGVS